MDCTECGSIKTCAHTDAELRRLHLLIWQCFECDEWFYTGWDIVEEGVDYDD